MTPPIRWRPEAFGLDNRKIAVRGLYKPTIYVVAFFRHGEKIRRRSRPHPFQHRTSRTQNAIQPRALKNSRRKAAVRKLIRL